MDLAGWRGKDSAVLYSSVYICSSSSSSSGGGQNHYEKVKREVREEQEMDGG